MDGTYPREPNASQWFRRPWALEILACTLTALAYAGTLAFGMIVPAALTGSVALLFAALTLVQQTQWANDIFLYTRGTESAPDNLTVRDNLANALLGANQPERAIPLHLDVLKRNLNFW